MSADLLRAAAAKAREVAEAARTYSDATTGAPLPWSASPHGDVHGRGGDWVCDSTGGNLAAHIALWHPGVALAVADLLDEAALLWDRGLPYSPMVDVALRLAGLLLGEADRVR